MYGVLHFSKLAGGQFKKIGSGEGPGNEVGVKYYLVRFFLCGKKCYTILNGIVIFFTY